MTITFTAPIPSSSLTVRRLVHFGANVVTRTIVCDFETGYINAGTFIVVGKEKRLTFTDETVPSFAQFIAACPATAQLRRQVELYETTLDVPGAVD